MIKIGVVGTPGGWSSERLADAVERRTGFRLIIDFKHVSLDLGTGNVWHEEMDISRLDALMVKKAGPHYSPGLLDNLEILRFLQGRGVPVFSDPRRIIGVLNRLSCTVTLKNGGIPMPPTTITQDTEKAFKVVETYGEAVLKPMFSSKARGMEVMKPAGDCRQRIKSFSEKYGMMYIQKRVDFGGQDLGLVFLGGKYLTTYARCAQGASWNTTTRSGGKYRACEPSPDIIALAHRAQALFGLDFTCVDVAETSEGPVVFEVSAFGGFKGIHTATGMDAADLYVAYVLERLKNAC
ncbi:GAK system ATP-grasp enzyme [Desulfocicer niacini]